MIVDAIRDECAEGNAQARLIARGVKIAKEIKSLAPNQVRALLMTLISRVNIRPDCVEKMLVENTDGQTRADPALLRIVARAHDIQKRLMHNSELTLPVMASQEHVTPG